MNDKSKKFIVIIIITILFTGSIIPVAAQNGVIAAGKRTIIQPLAEPATDLLFTVYQDDRPGVHIISWDININVSYSTESEIPSQEPANDGMLHSVNVEYQGLRVEQGVEVEIDVEFLLNEYNIVKFKDIYWTYRNSPQEKAMPSDTGWSVNTVPGTSPGGWTIAKFTTRDLNNKIVARDLVGHQFLENNAVPDLYKDMLIFNGTPYDSGDTPVVITEWSIANLEGVDFPGWDYIEEYTAWQVSASASITLRPGYSVTVTGQETVVTPTPPPTPTPSPKPTQSNSVSAKGRHTITQPSVNPATDLHFVVYQADRDDVYIIDWEILLNVPFTITNSVEDDWPFDDGQIHSVTVDIDFGRPIVKGEQVHIEATLYLNEWNTVKFANIYWTYNNSGQIDATPADTGWTIPTAPGDSEGGWTIAKFITQDLIGNTVGVDLVGHQYLQSHTRPNLTDMLITNGTPDNSGDTEIQIIGWSIENLIGVVDFPGWDYIDNYTAWELVRNDPIDIPPGYSADPDGNLYPNPTTGPTQTPTPGPVNLGDVNNDGTVDIVDALLVAQYYVGLDPANFDISNADTNCNNSVDIVDALLIAQYYVGLISGFC